MQDEWQQKWLQEQYEVTVLCQQWRPQPRLPVLAAVDRGAEPVKQDHHMRKTDGMPACMLRYGVHAALSGQRMRGSASTVYCLTMAYFLCTIRTERITNENLQVLFRFVSRSVIKCRKVS